MIVRELVKNHETKFRVVTPYDAQRGLIEHKLRSENLPWKDRCFNVDSFQGMSAP
jgi:superfamily I DNA and/or RNA helicase